MWKTQVEKEGKSVGLEEDAMNRERWRVRVNVGEIAEHQSGVYLATPINGDKPGSKLDDDDDDVNRRLCPVKGVK